MTDYDPRNRPPHWTFISGALFTIGLAIVGTFGLCTASLGYSTLIEILEEGDFSGLLLMLILGGVPMAVGAVLVWAGLKARPRA